MNWRLASYIFRNGRQVSVTRDSFSRINDIPIKVTNVILHNSHKNEFSTKPTQESKEVLVYEGPLSKQIRRVKLFSLVTSFSGFIAQPMVVVRGAELGSSSTSIFAICSVVGFFTYITPLLLHFITKKYVISIFYNPNENSYVASTYTLFLRTKKLHVKPGEGMLSNSPGMFTSVIVRGTPLFIDASFFHDVNHYRKIMGFDRPIDFKLKSNVD